jgi:hypothetical protein
MSTPVTGRVLIGPFRGGPRQRTRRQRTLPIHLVDGCGNRGARATSTDPFAVTCGACRRTRRWSTDLVTAIRVNLTALDSTCVK